jgi:hypothetical protein
LLALNRSKMPDASMLLYANRIKVFQSRIALYRRVHGTWMAHE